MVHGQRATHFVLGHAGALFRKDNLLERPIDITPTEPTVA
jgi:hypothetical protein